MDWKIEVRYKSNIPDAAGQGILEDIADLGISGVDLVKTAKVYWIEGNFRAREVDRICSELLADPVIQESFCQRSDGNSEVSTSDTGVWTVEVRFKPGVTDAVGDSVVKGIQDLGLPCVNAAQTGQRYRIFGDVDLSTIETISRRLLANEVIQTFDIKQEPD
ncbi:MAG: phosphoribosylformylglycinamidine synthase subunit PurS [Candidatus Poribacteria bacterium]|nr:phosphoribosylformylglycinamidine synthase subunit PurS [Candidatus Poribacteria bacterium]MDE0503400.1 phosphoribosylformylglycinamidine synthase subunit PurS [Candidatus Poribacteria bacterium]